MLSIENGWARVAVKNRFAVGDRLEAVHPGGNCDLVVTQLLADDGGAIQVAPGAGHVVRLALDPALALHGALLARYV